MPKIHIGEAIGLVMKTLPIVWVRLGSYAILGLALGLYAALFGGIGLLLGRLWAPLGIIVFFVAVGGAFWIVQLAGKYWFHLLRAAHTAVLTEFITTGKGPAGSQLDYGRQQVMSRFTDTSILFAVSMVVDGVVRFVVRTFTTIVGILPLPGIASLGKFLQRVALFSTTYVDEAILSRAYVKREQNVWAVAKDGVVLYAQAWKPILANAVALALLSYVWFLVFLLALGIPALAIGAMVPSLGTALGIGALIGAWMLKLALADAISLAATLLAYHRATAGMEPNQEWVAKLDGASEKFRELGRKAANVVTPTADVVIPSGSGSSPDAGDATTVNVAGNETEGVTDTPAYSATETITDSASEQKPAPSPSAGN